MTQDQRSTWLQKLDAECPYQIVLPRRQLMDDSAIMDFLLSYVGKFDLYARRPTLLIFEVEDRECGEWVLATRGSGGV